MVENTVGKGEIAHYEQFFLIPHCFQKTYLYCKNKGLFGKGLNDRICRKHGGKRRKCWLLAFSPFSTMFLKAFFSGLLKLTVSGDTELETSFLVTQPIVLVGELPFFEMKISLGICSYHIKRLSKQQYYFRDVLNDLEPLTLSQTTNS